jgi:hypothetical protein
MKNKERKKKQSMRVEERRNKYIKKSNYIQQGENEEI